VIYFLSFEILIIQIGEMPFYKPEFIIIKSIYFQKARKGECFLDDFEALVPEQLFRALVLQNSIVVREIDVRALLCGREMSF
jgi:hypothetical protein